MLSVVFHPDVPLRLKMWLLSSLQMPKYTSCTYCWKLSHYALALFVKLRAVLKNTPNVHSHYVFQISISRAGVAFSNICRSFSVILKKLKEWFESVFTIWFYYEMAHKQKKIWHPKNLENFCLVPRYFDIMSIKGYSLPAGHSHIIFS